MGPVSPTSFGVCSSEKKKNMEKSERRKFCKFESCNKSFTINGWNIFKRKSLWRKRFFFFFTLKLKLTILVVVNLSVSS
jgi:hypothetical protein